MKKKNLIIKDHVQREKTTDLNNSIKTKKNRKAVAPITPSGSTTNIRKKNNVGNATKTPINICSSSVDIHNTEQPKKFNKAKIQKKIDLNKTVIEPKKEIKKEYKTINPNMLKGETRSKSAAKRPIKHKNKDREKNKKEDIKKEDIDNNIKKEEIKKEEIKKEDNKKEDIKKEENAKIQKNIINNDSITANKDSKQKLNQDKKAINDPQRRKSIDLPIKKVIKKNNKEITENTKNREKRENRENKENREIRENSMKKRKPEINTQKTPNKIKNINYNNKSKDIAPLKTGKSGERGDFKFATNRNKKQIMNKTPDAGRMKNRRNLGGNENNAIKKQKYGNVDIKSIIKDSTKSNENEKEKEKNNNEEKIKENNNNKKEEKIIHYRKIRNKKYDSNYLECLNLALNSGFINPKKKLNIIINSKELYTNFDRKKIIKELIDYYEKIGNKNIINSAKKDKNKYDIIKINEPFKPNERSINAMNFIDKNEEQKLINEVQHPYIIELFKAIIILLNEYKNTDENKNIFDFFFNDILLKYKAKNIKKLMVNQFVNDRLIINDEQFELIKKMLLVKPDLFSPATLLRYNRAVAYFSFFVKELFSYLNQKTEEGIYFYKIRSNLPRNKYQDKINNLKLLL